MVSAAWSAADYVTHSVLKEASTGNLVVSFSNGLLFPEIKKQVLDLSLFSTGHLFAVAGILFSLFLFRAYRSYRNDSRLSDIWAILRAVVFFSIPAWVLTLMFPQWSVNNKFALLFPTFAFLFMGLMRFFEREIMMAVRAKGFNQRQVLIVGSKRIAIDLIQRFKRSRWMGIEVVGVVDDPPKVTGNKVEGIPVLGTIGELPEILKEHEVDQVYCALPISEMEKVQRVAEGMSASSADLRIVPDLFTLAALNSGVFEIDGLPVISIRETPLQGFGAFIKRCFDIVFSLSAILLFSLPMLIIAILIKLTSKGPVIYRQQRIAWDGAPFKIIKFRSMKVDAEEAGPAMATEDDPRVTPLGRFLRRYSLDELPQFFNVLAGSMSVVGPRPERPEFIQEFSREIPRYMLRHKTKAGLTGLAQVRGWRGNTSIRKRIQYDLYYIENWSIFFDIRIIAETAIKVFFHSNAY